MATATSQGTYPQKLRLTRLRRQNKKISDAQKPNLLLQNRRLDPIGGDMVNRYIGRPDSNLLWGLLQKYISSWDLVVARKN